VKFRRLGNSGLMVSAVGTGMGSSTTHFGERDDEVQIATMRRALDLGVTFFDTADRYQNGRHEVLLGKAVKGRRREVVIASKFGNFDLADDTKGYNGRPEYVPQACEASLKRLDVDVIDLYYLHRVDPEVPVEDTVGAMAQLVRQGKVRHLGLCEAGRQSLTRAFKVHPITAMQTEYSLWARDVEPEILPLCREFDVAFVPYAPLGRGLLTGTVTSLDQIAQGDKRRKQPRFQPGNLEHNLAMLKPLDEIAAAHGATKAQVALAWLIAQGEDIIPIPGTKQQQYLEQNVAALGLRLTAQELAVLAEAFRPGARAGDRYSPGVFTMLGV